MAKTLTFEDWIDVFAETIEEFTKRFSDDGKLSISDGLAILLVLLRSVAAASKKA